MFLYFIYKWEYINNIIAHAICLTTFQRVTLHINGFFPYTYLRISANTTTNIKLKSLNRSHLVKVKRVSGKHENIVAQFLLKHGLERVCTIAINNNGSLHVNVSDITLSSKLSDST